jgi:hypothetical protein
MASLLYCVTLPAPPISVNSGVCDAPVKSREILGVRLYWSNLDNPDTCFGGADAVKRGALQFHQVLREVLIVNTPIAFRFPTLLESEESFETHLSTEQELYRDALTRVDNALQYEVIGTWADEQEADFAKPVSGREYLERRRHAAGRVAAVESKLKAVTADSVREWRSRQERKTHRWFALVPRESRERFLASLRTAGGSEGIRLRLSGPWPPSEFVAPRGARG